VQKYEKYMVCKYLKVKKKILPDYFVAFFMTEGTPNGRE